MTYGLAGAHPGAVDILDSEMVDLDCSCLTGIGGITSSHPYGMSKILYPNTLASNLSSHHNHYLPSIGSS
jgi:hypothetical protein